MNCVKCGRETAEERVFCDVCLSEMEKYPVKPGTAVHITARNSVEEVRKAQPKKKQARTLSEQVLRLKKRVLRLRIAVVLLLLICGALCFAIERAVVELDFQRLLGQNYNIVSSVKETEPTAPLVETIVP